MELSLRVLVMGQSIFGFGTTEWKFEMLLVCGAGELEMLRAQSEGKLAMLERAFVRLGQLARSYLCCPAS
jgi:hypothetical protein